MPKNSLWRYFSLLTCDELCPFHMNYHIKIEDNDLKRSTSWLSQVLKLLHRLFLLFSFPFLSSTTLTEQKTGVFFSFTQRAEIIEASLPLPHADHLVIQTSGIIILCKLGLRFLLVPESLNEETRGRRYYQILWFYKSLEDTGLIKQGESAAAAPAVDSIHFPCQKARPRRF